MKPEDKKYYSDGYYPLFKLMVEEHELILTESQMFDIINCVRKMDEASERPISAVPSPKIVEIEGVKFIVSEVNGCKIHTMIITDL